MRVGIDGRLYINGTAANNASDVTVDMEVGTAEAKRRGSRVIQKVATLYAYAIEATYLVVAGDSMLTTLSNAFFNRTNLQIAAEDSGGAYGAGVGLRGVFIVTRFPRNEPLEEGQTFQITFEPAFGPTDPYWG